MEFQKTPHHTNRLFLYLEELPKEESKVEKLKCALGAFSFWGSFDAKTEKYFSWEFPVEIEKDLIKLVLSRLGCTLKEVCYICKTEQAVIKGKCTTCHYDCP